MYVEGLRRPGTLEDALEIIRNAQLRADILGGEPQQFKPRLEEKINFIKIVEKRKVAQKVSVDKPLR